jgi:hypothetical protein
VKVREAAIRDRQQGADDRADERASASAVSQRSAWRRSSVQRLTPRARDRPRRGGLGYSVEEHEVVLLGACADCS